MRARMDRERPGKGVWDLKLAPGGLVDIEFAAQALMLREAARGVDAISPNTGAALAALKRVGALGADDALALEAAWRLYSDLTQVLRICVDGTFEPEAQSGRLKALLASTGAAPNFDTLEARLAAVQGDIRGRFQRLVGLATETAPSRVQF
jgi:glutamate-ammonia-ligase adenylyltransferase